MKIAVFGTGGVGGYYGGRLAQAGQDVVFIARGAHLEAIRREGLRVDSLEGDFLVQSANATDDPAHVGPVDLVIVGVKAWQVPEAGRAMRPLVGPDTLVMPLQNGVEAPFQLAEVLGREHVIGGLCYLVTFVAAPGHIRHAGMKPYLAFGELDNRPPDRCQKILGAFTAAGLHAEVLNDIHSAMWMKFLFIASLSGVGAVTRAPVGVTRTVPETRRLLRQAITEIHLVARARRIALPDDAVESVLAKLDGLPPAATASMQRDIMDGRPSELESQSGAVVRLGSEADVETPVHAFMYASLLPFELRARGTVQFPS